jgi:hypothetical protein
MHHLSTDDLDYRGGGVPDRLFAAQKKYYDLRMRAEIAKRTASVAKQAMDEAERQLVAVMMDCGVRSLKLDDGSKPYLSSGVSIRCNEDNADDVRDFVNKQGWDAESLSTSKLDKWQVYEKVVDGLETGDLNELDIPQALGFKRYTKLNVEGWKTRKVERD